MTIMTSAEAAKELRKLNDLHDAVMRRENKSSVFTAAIQETVDDARPEYDFQATQEELEMLEEKIRIIKHAINHFNLTLEVPGFGMTIDQMLVYIPQLTERKRKLGVMRGRLPKERIDAYNRSSNIVEYEYSNYDIQEAEDAYTHAADELAKAQNALDVINSTVTFEVDI